MPNSINDNSLARHPAYTAQDISAELLETVADKMFAKFLQDLSVSLATTLNRHAAEIISKSCPWPAEFFGNLSRDRRLSRRLPCRERENGRCDHANSSGVEGQALTIAQPRLSRFATLKCGISIGSLTVINV